jgi:transposase-like protein
MDETFVRVGGRQMYLFRAVDSYGQTVDFYLSATRDREAAKTIPEHDTCEPGQPATAGVGQRWAA